MNFAEIKSAAIAHIFYSPITKKEVVKSSNSTVDKWRIVVLIYLPTSNYRVPVADIKTFPKVCIS